MSRRKQSKPKLLGAQDDPAAGLVANESAGDQEPAAPLSRPTEVAGEGLVKSGAELQQQQQQQHLITESSNHSNASSESSSGAAEQSAVAATIEGPAAEEEGLKVPSDLHANGAGSNASTSGDDEAPPPPQRPSLAQHHRPQLKPLKPNLNKINEDESQCSLGDAVDDEAMGSDELDELDEMGEDGDEFLSYLQQDFDENGDDQENEYDSHMYHNHPASNKRKREAAGADEYMNGGAGGENGDDMFDDEYEDEFEAKRRLGLDPNDPSDISGMLLPFKCKVCGKAFKHRRSLNRHTKLHSGEKNFKCPMCASAFARSDHLKAHLRTHNNTKPYRCSICQCGYNSPSALKVHMSHNHGRSKYHCHECDIDFHSQLSLEGHMYTKHGRHAHEIEAEYGRYDAAEYEAEMAEFGGGGGEAGCFNEEETFRENDEDSSEAVIIDDEANNASAAPLNVPLVLGNGGASNRQLRPILPKANGNSVSPKSAATAAAGGSSQPASNGAAPSQHSSNPATPLMRSALTTPIAKSNGATPTAQLNKSLPPNGKTPPTANANGSRFPPRPLEPSNTYCELCNARFSSVDSYMAHMRNCHPSIYNQHQGVPRATAAAAPSQNGGFGESSLAAKMPLLTNVLQNAAAKASEALGPLPPAVSQITKVIPFSAPINHHQANATAASSLNTGIVIPIHGAKSGGVACRIPNCNCTDTAAPTAVGAAGETGTKSPVVECETSENPYVIKETHTTCVHCNMTFFKSAEFIEHLKHEHCVEVFRCMLCKQMQLFDNLNLLKEHFLNVHQSKKLEFFRCKLCQPAANAPAPASQLHRQVYHSIDELNGHLQNVHQIQQPSQFTAIFAARVAPPAQPTPTPVAAAAATAAPPALHGSVFGAAARPAFGNGGFGGRCYKCTHCESDFAQLNSLHQHMLVAHNVRVPPSSAADEGVVSRPPQLNGGSVAALGTFPCQYCRSTFSNRIQLERHLRIHVSSIDLKCNICDRTFENQDVLNQHKLTHCKTFNNTPVNGSSNGPAASGKSESPRVAATQASPAPASASPAASSTAICVYCKQTIENDMQFREHFKRHNNIGGANGGVKSNSFICIVCRQTLSSSNEYYLHLRHHLKKQSAPAPAQSASAQSGSFIARALSGESPADAGTKKTGPEISTMTESLDKFVFEDKFRCYKCLVKFEEWQDVVEHMSAAHKITVPLSLLAESKKAEQQDETVRREQQISPGRGKPAVNGHVTITPVIASPKTAGHNGGVGHHEDGNENESQSCYEACEICQIQFESAVRLQAHLLIKHEFFSSNNVFTCPVCDELFSKPESLLAHTAQHGQAAKIYKCSQCPLSFVFKSQLINHSYVHHPASKQGPARPNGISENRSSLNQYGLRHPQMSSQPQRGGGGGFDEKPRSIGGGASLGNKALNWSANQVNRQPPAPGHAVSPASQHQQHQSPSLAAASNYRCTKCNVEFASLKMYQHHFESVHSTNPLAQTNANYSASMMSAGNKYTCPYCSKLFASQRNLNFHVRIHTGFRPFECDICQRRFTRRDNLRNHMKCHLNVRPFLCPICNKGFTRKSHLISHLETHLKSRIHTCQKCSLQFTSLSIFIKHLYSEHSMNDKELLEFVRSQTKPLAAGQMGGASGAAEMDENELGKDNDLVIASAAVALMKSSTGEGLECDDNDDKEDDEEYDEEDYRSQDSFEGLNAELDDDKLDGELEIDENMMDENQEAAAYLENDLMPPTYKNRSTGTTTINNNKKTMLGGGGQEEDEFLDEEEVDVVDHDERYVRHNQNKENRAEQYYHDEEDDVEAGESPSREMDDGLLEEARTTGQQTHVQPSRIEIGTS